MSGMMDNLGFDVSRETSDRLDHYFTLLKKWNPRINLISPNTLAEAPVRHFQDSAQVIKLIPKDTVSLADFGSGAGFPGAVIAIIARETHPELEVTLIESDQRKASFLRTALRETQTTGQVLSKRIESVDPLNLDVVTARALAPLSNLCGFAHHHLARDGIALFLKGKTWGKELEDAQAEWKFGYTAHTSQTDSNAVILELRELTHD